MVEEQRNVHHQEHKCHALCTNVVRQNFGRVRDKHARPGQVVEDVVDVNHSDYGIALSLDSSLRELSSASGPDDESCKHARCGHEEECSTTDVVDHEALSDGDDEVHDLQAAVDDELRVAVGYADVVEDEVEVVACETISRPLREESESQKNDQTAAVALGVEELQPAVAFKLFLESDGVLDLLELEEDDFVFAVTICVDFGENVVCLLHFTLGKEETWRFGHEPNKQKLQNRWDCLQHRWNSPGPVVADVVGAECAPCSDDASKVPSRVIDCSEDCTMLWVHQLRDE